MVCTPAPLTDFTSASLTFEENRPALYPLILASRVCSNNLRMSEIHRCKWPDWTGVYVQEGPGQLLLPVDIRQAFDGIIRQGYKG